jgi:hypothetical protein
MLVPIIGSYLKPEGRLTNRAAYNELAPAR